VELENIWMEMSADRCTQRKPGHALLVQLHVETAGKTLCVLQHPRQLHAMFLPMGPADSKRHNLARR